VQLVLGRKPAGRLLTVFPNDIFLVGYYRFGTTWSSFIFGNYVHQDQPVTFANLDYLVPSIYRWPDRIIRKRPRILKSHEYFDPRYPRIIYLVRDPRDVAVSIYFYSLKVRALPDAYPMEDFVKNFVAVKTLPTRTALALGKSTSPVGYGCAKERRIFALFDTKTFSVILRLSFGKRLRSCRSSQPPKESSGAIKLSSAERMRSLEKLEWHKWTITKRTRQDIPFVREAQSGSWLQYLPEASVRLIEEKGGGTMQELGYELASVSQRQQCGTITP